MPWIRAVTAIRVVVARMIPSSVRKLRSLFLRSESRAMRVASQKEALRPETAISTWRRAEGGVCSGKARSSTRGFRHRRRHLLLGEARQHFCAIGHMPYGGRNHGGGLAGVLGDDALVGIEVGVPGVALVFDGVLLHPDAGQAGVAERGT